MPKRDAVSDGAPRLEKKKDKKKLKQGALSAKGPMPPHRYILAPMVGGSELAFRLLCRRYASRELLCYTPMMNSVRFSAEPAYRKEAFQTLPADRPLVAHFCGNDPATLLAAAKHVEGHCDAVDLNLGCPQRIAHSGHFGSYLLDDVDRSLVLEIVRTLATGLSIPVFCKVRLLETTDKTIDLCASLRDAGAALIAIHARHRVNLVGRSGPGARDGPALLEEVRKVVDAVPGVPIISNGNVKTWGDVCANLKSTCAHGIMSAEGMLDDPALFMPSMVDAGVAAPAGEDEGSAEDPAAKEARKVRKKLREIDRLESKGEDRLTPEEKDKVAKRKKLQKELKRINAGRQAGRESEAPPVAMGDDDMGDSKTARKEGGTPPPSLPAKPAPLELARQYCELAEEWGVAVKTRIFHVRRMAKESLVKVQLLAEVLEAADGKSLTALVQEAIQREQTGFRPDPERVKAEREALELKKWREQTRKRFEERMIRKAKRAGLEGDHFLKQGSEVPTVERLKELKAMAPDAAWADWKTRHGQHCWAMHMQEGGCTRERSCAFLHAEVSTSPDPAWHG